MAQTVTRFVRMQCDTGVQTPSHHIFHSETAVAIIAFLPSFSALMEKLSINLPALAHIRTQ